MPPLLAGGMKGCASLMVIFRQVAGTNAYLIVIDLYLSEPVSGQCGVLSFNCPSSTFPEVRPLVEDICAELLPRNVYRVAGTAALLPDYSQVCACTLHGSEGCVLDGEVGKGMDSGRVTFKNFSSPQAFFT